jgi:hypothetical protein
MLPQLPVAAADAPSVPAKARDVVGRRWSFLRRSESQGLETNPARRDNVGGELPHISTTIGTPSGSVRELGKYGMLCPSWPLA